MSQRPMLFVGGLSNRIFVVTRYKMRVDGGFEAVEKFDMTDEILAIVAAYDAQPPHDAADTEVSE